MRTSALLCVLLFAVILTVDATNKPWPTCLPVLCRDLGETCYPSRDIFCKDGYYCKTVGKFPEEHGVCVEGLRPGDECENNFNDCDKLLDLKCITVNQTSGRQECHVRGFKSPGEDCAADYHCFGGAEGACVKPKYDCQGLASGGECYNSAECQNSQICNFNGKCADPTPLDGACMGNSAECGIWDIRCTPKTAGSAEGSCKKIHTTQEGAPCFEDLNCDEERFKCKKDKESDITGVCTKLKPPSNKTCAVNADCTENFETCSCNPYNGIPACNYVVPVYGYSKIVEDAFKCASENLCKTTSYYPTSCTYIFCRQSFGCYETARREMAHAQEPDPCYRRPDKFDDVHYTTCVAPPAQPKDDKPNDKIGAATSLLGNSNLIVSALIVVLLILA